MENNSVLLEDSNLEPMRNRSILPPEGTERRKSMSQPSLAAREKSEKNDVRYIPIVQTWHENEQLKGLVYSLRTEVQMYSRNYTAAKEACDRSVQEVLDDYIRLQMEEDERVETQRENEAMRKEVHTLREQLESVHDALARQTARFEEQKREMEQRIRELESDNSTGDESLRGNLDDILKKSDPDQTLAEQYDRRIDLLENELLTEREHVVDLEMKIQTLQAELECQSARLADSESIRAQLEAVSKTVTSATFMIEKTSEAQTEEQIKYIDELETKLKASTSESDKARLALVEYMNRCSKLEHDIHVLKKNTMLDQSSSILADGKSSEDLRTEIQKEVVALKGELEVCQATLKKVETEKAALASELADLEDRHRLLTVELDEARSELDKALINADEEQKQRQEIQNALDEASKMVVVMKKNASQQSTEVRLEMEKRVEEVREQVETSSHAMIKKLEEELKIALTEENSLRDYANGLGFEMEKLKKRTHDAEGKLEEASNEKQMLIRQMGALEDQIERLSAFEKESTDCAAKMAARKKEAESAKQRDEMEKEAIEGLERIQKEMRELTKKKTKAQIIKGNASSVRLVCEELCRRLAQERTLQHEAAETMAVVNEKLIQMEKERVEKENAAPQSSVPEEPYRLKPVHSLRGLLQESTMAIDVIIQHLKATVAFGMGPKLKELVATVITESRALRSLLHENLRLARGINDSNWKNETRNELLRRVEQCVQDNLMLRRRDESKRI